MTCVISIDATRRACVFVPTRRRTPRRAEKTSEEMPCLNSIFASLPLYPFLHSDVPEIFRWRSAGVSYSVCVDAVGEICAPDSCRASSLIVPSTRGISFETVGAGPAPVSERHTLTPTGLRRPRFPISESHAGMSGVEHT